MHRMKSHVQILTTPTADTPGTTLMLHFDNRRYLIGSLAEGTQRACIQMGARLLKVSECFVTGRTEWRNIGGMIGMILTLADSSAASHSAALAEALKKVRARAKKLGFEDDVDRVAQLEEEARKESTNTMTFFGPPNLNHMLATARRYVFRKGMPVDIREVRGQLSAAQKEHRWAPSWADDNISMWSMAISPDEDVKQSSTRHEPASVSPRKRSIDEVYAQEGNDNVVTSEQLSAEDRGFLTARAVVAEMFNSSWRLDTLYETRLGSVKLPATLFVRNGSTNKIERYTGALPGAGHGHEPDPDTVVLVRRPWPGALVESLPPTKHAKEAVSYIFRNHTQRGKFKPDEATRLKVKKGRDWAELAAGKNVISMDGQTITPDMVLGASKQGGGIAVVDLPGREYVASLIDRPEWREDKVMAGVGAIVWICGKGVATDPRLHAFMQELKHLEHVVSSPDYCANRLSLDSAAAATVRLRQVDPDRHGVPVHDGEKTGGEQTYGGDASYLTVRDQHRLPSGVHIADRGLSVQLEPTIEIQEAGRPPVLNVNDTIAEIPTAVIEESTKAQEAANAPDPEIDRWLSTLPPGAAEVEIITLGTGSALPSKYRNVSATLVRIPYWGNVLLDCGENTLGQLKRVFTAADFKEVLANLKMIWISHMHADHQLGTTSVVKAWYEEVHNLQPAQSLASGDYTASIQAGGRLSVVSEPAMQHWLAEYSAVEDFGYSRLAPLVVSPAGTHHSSSLNWHIPPPELRALSREQYTARMSQSIVPPSALGLADLQAVTVQHCHGARAVSITLPGGFKVSYSGDCRPSRAFSRIGRGSTVCIHEATFDDELAGDALAKNHCTTSEALGVAQAMDARACLLTHFSQRYQKVPVLERGEDATTGGAVPEVGDDMGEDVEDDADAPLEGGNGAAATFPDQETAGDGQSYDLPAKGGVGDVAPASSGTEAVRFKVTSDMKVCVAFDYMRVKVGDIAQLEKFTPALLKLFATEEEQKGGLIQRASVTGPAAGGKKEKKEKKKTNGQGR